MTLQIEIGTDGRPQVKGYTGRDAHQFEAIRQELKARMANRKKIKVLIPKKKTGDGNLADAIHILQDVIKSL